MNKGKFFSWLAWLLSLSWLLWLPLTSSKFANSYGSRTTMWRKLYCAAWSGLSHTWWGDNKLVWSNGGKITNREDLKNSDKNLLQCHYDHHEPYMKSSRIEHRSPWWEVSIQPPELWHWSYSTIMPIWNVSYLMWDILFCKKHIRCGLAELFTMQWCTCQKLKQ